jgi:hypothetical protein
MTAQHASLLANHERIRAALRGALVHTAQADHGDLVAALALSRDLTEVVKGLEAEAGAAFLGDSLARATTAACRAVAAAASSLSYAFSVRVVLECVAALTRLLAEIEASLAADAPSITAAC